VNGDGKPDVLTPGTLFLNAGNGKFVLAGPPPGPADLIADMNNDGFADLVGSTPSGVVIWPGDGSGTFTASAILMPAPQSEIVVADLDQDGRKDFIVHHTLLFNQGGFQFTSQTFLSVEFPVAPGDFNGDGRIDIAVTGGPILLNQGNRQFVPGPGPSIGVGGTIAVGDFNGDGRADIATVGTDPWVGVAFGSADGSFRNGTRCTSLGPSEGRVGRLPRQILMAMDGWISPSVRGITRLFFCEMSGTAHSRGRSWLPTHQLAA
jgi:hypothetical protein